jgi:hypothetical protein
MTVNHYPSCIANSIGCAVENIRDMIADPMWADEKATLDAMDAATLLDHVQARAAEYREDGTVTCDCHARELRTAEDALRRARKAFRAGRVSQAVVDGAKAIRDELKAAS